MYYDTICIGFLRIYHAVKLKFAAHVVGKCAFLNCCDTHLSG